MAFTARLNPDLEAQAKAYAATAGVSLNALLAISLRDYLGGRGAASLPSASEVIPVRGRPWPAKPSPETSSATRPSVLPSAALVAPTPSVERIYRKPASMSDPCPCGATSPVYGYPLKWKHCHGQKVG